MKKFLVLAGLTMCANPSVYSFDQRSGPLKRLGAEQRDSTPKRTSMGKNSIDALSAQELIDKALAMQAATFGDVELIKRGILPQQESRFGRVTKQWNQFARREVEQGRAPQIYDKYVSIVDVGTKVLFALTTRLHKKYGDGAPSLAPNQILKGLESLEGKHASLLKALEGVQGLTLRDLRGESTQVPAEWAKNVPTNSKQVLPNYELMLEEFKLIKDEEPKFLYQFLNKQGVIDKAGNVDMNALSTFLDKLEKIAYIQEQKSTKGKKGKLRGPYLALSQELIRRIHQHYSTAITTLDREKLLLTQDKDALVLYLQAQIIHDGFKQLFAETQALIDDARTNVEQQTAPDSVKELRKRFEKPSESVAAAA